MTGVITSIPPLVEQPPGNNSSNPAGLPGFTYTVAVLGIAQMWTALQTFPQGNISVHYQDIIGLSPSASVDTTNASNITSGTLAAAQLPNPTSSTLGGVRSIAAVSHNWISSISTSGVPSLSQPAFSDILGTAAASQLPTPTASTLGGIQSTVGVSHQWISTISTAGVPGLTQPAFTDISGQAGLTQLPTLGANTVLGSIAGGTPIALTTTQITTLVNAFTTSLNGSVPTPGSSTGKFLRDDGTWQSAGGTGTVTSVAGGTGLSGGTITTTGTLAVSLSSITASLGADVALNNTGLYFDGPSVAQGTSGTWFASGTVTLVDTAGGANFNIKLWDGTTVIASASVNANSAVQRTVSLSGVIASPAANIKISVQDPSAATGKIQFNASGNSKDSTITAIRIA